VDVDVKICGLDGDAALEAAIEAGAALVGLVFYPPSPRSLPLATAGRIARRAGDRVRRVGVTVDPSDAELAAILAEVPLDLIQLHGKETPARAAAIRSRFGLPVMKAVSIAGPEDVERVDGYLDSVDRLLFDAKPPRDLKDALPGGNAIAFDWRLIAGRRWPLPWMLSGGLTPANVAEAIALTGARAVDVSSGVERAPGVKDLDKIRAFVAAARGAA
jgi:phosphoribosylanthranilate isomerase